MKLFQRTPYTTSNKIWIIDFSAEIISLLAGNQNETFKMHNYKFKFYIQIPNVNYNSTLLDLPQAHDI